MFILFACSSLHQLCVRAWTNVTNTLLYKYNVVITILIDLLQHRLPYASSFYISVCVFVWLSAHVHSLLSSIYYLREIYIFLVNQTVLITCNICGYFMVFFFLLRSVLRFDVSLYVLMHIFWLRSVLRFDVSLYV